MTEGEWSRAKKRDLMRLLRRLLKGSVETPSDGASGLLMVVGDEQPYPADLVRRAVSLGLIRQEQNTFSATEDTAGFCAAP
jgi:hypothetical protein